MAKAYKATELAEWFIQRADRDAGDAMTHLKLQKLLYYAQAWHLANYNQRLFNEDLKAWTHGPVVPSVWGKYRDYGWNMIPPAKKAPELDEQTIAFLDAVFSTYGRYSAKVLEDLTHSEPPWRDARGNLPPEAASQTPISDKTMRDHFAAKIDKTWQTSVAPIS